MTWTLTWAVVQDYGDECSDARKPSAAHKGNQKSKARAQKNVKSKHLKSAPMPNYASGEGRQVCIALLRAPTHMYAFIYACAHTCALEYM